MKKEFQKYSSIFLISFALILFSVLVINNHKTVNKSHYTEATNLLGNSNTNEKAEYNTASEEKEAPHFNIFTIINKFISN